MIILNFYMYTQFSVIYHYCFYTSPYIMCNEIELLIFVMEDMYSLHCLNKFLYIIVPHFYILLEQLSVHFHTILYIVGAHFYALLEHFDIHCWNGYLYTSTQFYTWLVYNSIHCSMHYLGWGRHDPDTIILRREGIWGSMHRSSINYTFPK
jgi:hypothetical protein